MTAAAVVAALAVWGAAASWLAIVDHRTRTLPTRVVRSTAGAVWLLYAAASILEADPAGLAGAAIGAAICGGALAVVHFAHPPSLGFGDVRLAVLNGMLCGWWGWRTALAALAAGFLLAFPQAVVTLIREGRRASRALGPYLIAGTAGVAAWSAVSEGLVPFAG
ncbi:MAG: prepilin peptidase [bacterium]|nr:prepilin peptidase [bacterium]